MRTIITGEWAWRRRMCTCTCMRHSYIVHAYFCYALLLVHIRAKFAIIIVSVQHDYVYLYCNNIKQAWWSYVGQGSGWVSMRCDRDHANDFQAQTDMSYTTMSWYHRIIIEDITHIKRNWTCLIAFGACLLRATAMNFHEALSRPLLWLFLRSHYRLFGFFPAGW